MRVWMLLGGLKHIQTLLHGQSLALIEHMQKKNVVLTARLSSGGAFLFSSSYIRIDSSNA